MQNKDSGVEALAELLGPMVSEIASANGMVVDGKKVAKAIGEQNSLTSPIIAQQRARSGSVYYIVYAKDQTEADPNSLIGLSELDVTVKLKA